MNVRKMVAIGATVCSLVVPAQFVVAGTSDSAMKAQSTAAPQEEYQLRLLEEQIQVLHNQLYMRRGKMSEKQKTEWHKRYNALKTTLSGWNDSIDGVH